MHSQLQALRLTDDIEHEADKTVMGRKRQQHSIDQDYVLEVVDDAFPVEKIHGGPEEIPIQRAGKRKVLGSAGNVGYRNDLFEGDNLDGGDDTNDVDMAGEHGEEEAEDHDKAPYRPGDEGLFLLFVL